MATTFSSDSLPKLVPQTPPGDLPAKSNPCPVGASPTTASTTQPGCIGFARPASRQVDVGRQTLPPALESIPSKLVDGLPPDIEWWTHYYDPQVPHQRDASGRIVYNVEEVKGYFARHPVPTDRRWWAQMYVPRFAGVNMNFDAWNGPGNSSRRTLDSASYAQLSVRNRGGDLEYSTRLLQSPEWQTLWRSPVYGPVMLTALDAHNARRQQTGLPTVLPAAQGEPPGVDRQLVAKAFSGPQPAAPVVASNGGWPRPPNTPAWPPQPKSGADAPLPVPRSASRPPSQGSGPLPPAPSLNNERPSRMQTSGGEEGSGFAGASTRTHVVRQGDTLFGIARRMGIDLPDLLRANPSITDARRLVVGQRIHVPRAERSSAR
jgi:LysM domain